MSEKRVTRKDYFQILGELAIAAGREDAAQFCEKEIAKLANRKSVPTKKQKENEGVIELLREVLTDYDTPITVSELIKDERLAGMVSQKATALLTKMKNDGIVVRTEEKGKAYYSIVE